ncbi:hypothetical protein D9Q98_004803 [Chlorella vulgaris]|uniref:Protein kinase domain-containing protein n=1 Tax=Chlorella vulgaris TaxID=3077 RepID=A0A9D4YXC8_CHLVU|nr:hypothetical protein D9Q98_004803 [Chlorella vulgaris]
MASLPPGTFLNQRYLVIRELNRGGTAVVYEADDRQACRHVALKVMTGGGGATAAAAVKAAQRELACAAALRDKHIVQLMDWFTEAVPGVGQLLVIVWELVKGMDLLDLLNAHSGRLSEEMAAAYFLQLARGVAAIHANGLVHRDLKPENCMVDGASGSLKIIDFGLSKRQQSAVTLGVGTPDYMAPELLGSGDLSLLRQRQTGTYDATACDCWSLGVLLYLLVVGHYPFEDPARPQNVVTTLQNITAGRYRALPPSLSPACADLIARLLTRDAAARIRLADTLAHPFLAAALAAEAAAAAEEPQGPVAMEEEAEEQGQAKEEEESSPTIAAGVPERLPSFAFTTRQPDPVNTKATPHVAPLSMKENHHAAEAMQQADASSAAAAAKHRLSLLFCFIPSFF